MTTSGSPHPPPPPPPKPPVDVFDSNQDGAISASEFATFCQFFTLVAYFEDQAYTQAQAEAVAEEGAANLAELEELEREGAWDEGAFGEGTFGANDDAGEDAGEEEEDELARELAGDVQENDGVLNNFMSSSAVIEANLSRMPDSLMIELTSPEWAERCLDRFEVSVSPESTSERKQTLALKSQAPNSARASSPLFTQPALTTDHPVTHLLISA